MCTMRTDELGRGNIWGRWRAGFLTGPKCSEAPVWPPRPESNWSPRSILGLHYSIAHTYNAHNLRSILGTVSLSLYFAYVSRIYVCACTVRTRGSHKFIQQVAAQRVATTIRRYLPAAGAHTHTWALCIRHTAGVVPIARICQPSAPSFCTRHSHWGAAARMMTPMIGLLARGRRWCCHGT
jgi:hypothetical protein